MVDKDIKHRLENWIPIRYRVEKITKEKNKPIKTNKK
jgi:hypothetical protein